MNIDCIIRDMHTEERLENAERVLKCVAEAEIFADDVFNEIQMQHMRGAVVMAEVVVANCKRELGCERK